MPNIIIAQPLPVMHIQNPLYNLPMLNTHRETPRPQDVAKALALLETGKMEIILTKHNTSVLARWASESRGREGQEYWIDPSGCECGWWKFGGTCKHYVAFNLICVSLAYAHNSLEAERMATAFEQDADERLTIVAKLIRKATRLVQDIKDGTAQRIEAYLLPEGFPCPHCREALDFDVCLGCHRQLNAYRLAPLAKFCSQCHHRKAHKKSDICKTCENANNAAEREKKRKAASSPVMSDIEAKIEERRATRKTSEPSQAQVEAERQIDQFFFSDTELALKKPKPAPSRITNAVREASPTVRRRHKNRTRK